MTALITITPAPGKYAIRAGGAVLGETDRALELREGDYPPVIYVPREDMAMAFLDRSDHTSVCPHKGTASYFHIIAKSGPIKNAVWSYETPKDGMEQITGYLAFYPNKVTVEKI